MTIQKLLKERKKTSTVVVVIIIVVVVIFVLFLSCFKNNIAGFFKVFIVFSLFKTSQ